MNINALAEAIRERDEARSAEQNAHERYQDEQDAHMATIRDYQRVKADLSEAVALLRRALWQTEHDQNCDIVVEVDGRANRTIEPCTCAHNPIRAFLARVDGAK